MGGRYSRALSDRELEVLRLVAEGEPNKRIAFVLCLSPNTVKIHVTNIATKLGAADRTHAAVMAVGVGIID